MEIIDVANHVLKLQMYPYFEIAHVIICCLHVRADFGHENLALAFSRKHPLSCWLSCMLSVFSGSILSNFLLNEPIVGAFKNTQQVLLATATWYLMFYSPFDLVFKFCQFLPFKLIIASMKEVLRCYKIHQGVLHASKIYPSSYFIIVLVGTVKGNGAGFCKLLERLFRGQWSPTSIEFIHPTFATKASIAASILFYIDKKTDWISAPHAIVYLVVVIFLVHFKLSSLLLGIQDPFRPIENVICAIFFGGIWDAIGRMLTATQSSRGSRAPSSSRGWQSSATGHSSGKAKDSTRNGKTDALKAKQD